MIDIGLNDDGVADYYNNNNRSGLFAQSDTSSIKTGSLVSSRSQSLTKMEHSFKVLAIKSEASPLN